jgi:hypothetical protein
MSFYVKQSDHASRWSSGGGENYAPKVLPGCLLAYVIVGIICAIPMLWSWQIQASDIGGYKDDVRRRNELNLLYKSADDRQNEMTPNTPGFQLFSDLSAFMQSVANDADAPANPFGPRDLKSVQIPPNRYYGLYDQLGGIVYENLTTQHYGDDGYLTPEFVNNFTIAYGGNSERVIEAPPVRDHDVDLTIWHDVSFLQFFAAVFILLQLTIIQMVGHGFFSDGTEYKVHRLRDFSTWLGLILAPGYYVPLMVWFWWHHSSEKRKAKEQKQIAAKAELRQQMAMMNHPLRGHLYTARENLTQLKNLLQGDPTSKELAKAVKEQQKFVDELSTFPETLTRQSARSLLNQVHANNDETRNAITSILAAREEAEDPMAGIEKLIYPAKDAAP